MIYFECSGCAEELSVPASLAGEILQCPVCAAQVKVPFPQAKPPEEQVSLAVIEDDLYHASPDVRVKAVRALSRQVEGNPDAVRMLVRKFRDRDRSVRDAVLSASITYTGHQHPIQTAHLRRRALLPGASRAGSPRNRLRTMDGSCSDQHVLARNDCRDM